MKNRVALSIICLLLSACVLIEPSENQIQTAIAETQISRPTESHTPTFTATLTATLTPTITITPTVTQTLTRTDRPTRIRTSIPTPTKTTVPRPTNTPKPSSGCISWNDAGSSINQYTCVEGVVSQIYDAGNAFFINFSNSYAGFYGVSFDYVWDDSIVGACIHITGTISTYEGRPQIIIRNRGQVEFCK